jgi:dihydrodipicolinate synthase/N-acetylneuraminate lyase
MINKFNGIIPPMLMPLLSNWKLDSEGVKKLVDHMVDGGVHGIFILGTSTKTFFRKGNCPNTQSSRRYSSTSEKYMT